MVSESDCKSGNPILVWLAQIYILEVPVRAQQQRTALDFLFKIVRTPTVELTIITLVEEVLFNRELINSKSWSDESIRGHYL